LLVCPRRSEAEERDEQMERWRRWHNATICDAPK